MKRNKYWTQEEDSFLKENYIKQGLSKCSDFLKRTKPSVLFRIKKLEIKITRQKLIVDGKRFVKLDTPASVYICGFLFADGHVRRNDKMISLGIVSEDAEKILNLFMEFGYWNMVSRKIKHWKPQTRISTTNKEIYTLLQEADYCEKSNAEPTKILEKIPENLRHYFWRGFSDGDGSFYVGRCKKFTVAGKIDYQWTEVSKMLQDIKIDNFQIERRKTKTGESSLVQMDTFDAIIKLGEYIYQGYPNDNIGLPRKYKKFQEIKERAPTDRVKITNIKTGETHLFKLVVEAQRFLGCAKATVKRICKEKKVFNGYFCERIGKVKSRKTNV